VRKSVQYVEEVQKPLVSVVFAPVAVHEVDSEMQAGLEGGNRCRQAAAGLGSFGFEPGLGSQ